MVTPVTSTGVRIERLYDVYTTGLTHPLTLPPTRRTFSNICLDQAFESGYGYTAARSTQPPDPAA